MDLPCFKEEIMKVCVFTLGCKVNECESDSLISELYEKGYDVTDKMEYADVYVINTCAVTGEAEKKSRQTSSRVKALNENAKIIYIGCASQKNPQAFMEKDNVLAVGGTFGKGDIVKLIDTIKGNIVKGQGTEYEELFPVKTLRSRTYVKVQDGCNNFCSYCIVPYLRGRSRSRNPQNVIDEIERVKPKEAVINGINLSDYNYNGKDLSFLMNELKDVDCRIRLGSLEVNVITDKFLTSLKGLKDFAPHFHLSLQSGSDNVLKKMNRHYTTDEYYGKVQLIRKYFPDAGITTDIIVGFPTEREEDFIQTVEFAKKVGFSDIHPFIYSAREGTVASKMQQLDGTVKKERLDKLLEVKYNLKKAFLTKYLNKTLRVFPEEYKDGYTEGYSENYLRVYVKGEMEKEITSVKAKELYLDGLIAETVTD